MSDRAPKKFARRLLADVKAEPKRQRWRSYTVIFDRGFLGSDKWHLSVSQVAPPAVGDTEALAELVEALGVPSSMRQGEVIARQFKDGKFLPEVRHWHWPIDGLN